MVWSPFAATIVPTPILEAEMGDGLIAMNIVLQAYIKQWNRIQVLFPYFHSQETIS